MDVSREGMGSLGFPARLRDSDTFLGFGHREGREGRSHTFNEDYRDREQAHRLGQPISREGLWELLVILREELQNF
jgi:hypothetical protein